MGIPTVTDMSIPTSMTEISATTALVRLVTWLSPAFPTGAFSYSGGLEQAVQDGLLKDATDLEGWLSLVIERGTGWNDAVLLAESYRAVDDVDRLLAVMELAEALAGSRERHMETLLQGEAFIGAASHWPHPVLALLGSKAAYPVAVGAVAGAHATGLEPVLAAYLHAQASNAVSAAIRCGVTGQRGGVGVLAGLESLVTATAAKASESSLDDLGSAGITVDIAGLRHETLRSRLFRS